MHGRSTKALIFPAASAILPSNGMDKHLSVLKIMAVAPTWALPNHLASVLKGFGNNAEDRTEGAIYRNAYGTYLHGSLLPKNPHFADYLIELALQRKYSNQDIPQTYGINGNTPFTSTSDLFVATDTDTSSLKLAPLDDSLEWQAHATILERLGLYTEAAQVLSPYQGQTTPALSRER